MTKKIQKIKNWIFFFIFLKIEKKNSKIKKMKKKIQKLKNQFFFSFF